MRKPLFFLIPIVLLGISACKKFDVTVSPASIVSVDDAATMIAASLTSNTNGFNIFSPEAVTTSQGVMTTSTGCGITHIDSVSHVNTPGSNTAFSYKYKISNKLNCNSNNVADNVTSTLTFNGNFNGPNLSSVNGGSSVLTIAGFSPTSLVYSITGQLKSTGSFTVKPDSTKKGTIGINVVIKSLVITKATATTHCIITSGSGTATITGNSPKGAFTFTGALTFNGNNVATFTLGTTTYSVDLLTGVITKK